MEDSKLLEIIKAAAYEVRLALHAGYLESVYQNALAYELRLRGLLAETEEPIAVEYKGVVVGCFRADILVEKKVIIEIKAVSELHPIHEVQLVNYLVSTGLDYGFLINYGSGKYRIALKRRLYKQLP